ncbi:hypothetical protein Tcan_16718 [Toxocara canis]|uniref:Uncharacterized protein n=1 Tax=Toxocara canis TaxID=6265 RepID=A0A0B2VAV8_TOXCA|nr:hypothetical protein Tcan_16718 [Toxocara canis]
MENVAGTDSARAIAVPKSLWESSKSSGPSCYGSLNASTSSACASGITRSGSITSQTPAYEKLPKSDSADFVDAPKFHYDMDFDLRALKAALKSAEFLEESGYQSVLERSQHNQYGTGWLINENMSEDGSDDVDDNWGELVHNLSIVKIAHWFLFASSDLYAHNE